MKKRFKLITTVASLCLAVALMAFGVYAASNSTLTVASKVSFEAQVAVTWSVKVSGGTLEQDYTASKSYTVTDSQTAWDGSKDAENAFPAEVPFAAVNGNTVTYEFTCKNDSTAVAHVTVNANFKTPAEGANWSVEYYVNDAKETWGTEEISATTGTVTYKVVFTLISAGAEVEAADTAFDITFTALPGAAE